jgi:hypothetical protein
MGMTAYEQLPETDQDVRDEPERPVLGFSGISNNEFTDMMLDGFRQYLAGRDDRAAELVGGFLDHRERSKGVKEDDVVVALVGGFHPYGMSKFSFALPLYFGCWWYLETSKWAL